jgi:hypothetical protein
MLLLKKTSGFVGYLLVRDFAYNATTVSPSIAAAA